MIELNQNEKILIMVRKHWLSFVSDLSYLVFVLVMPAIVYVLIRMYPFERFVFIGGNTAVLLGFLASLWLLFVWGALFITWTDYYLDVLVITNMRVFNIEQKALFNRESSICRMDRIQDMTVEVRGILATLLHYGHIHIQTAGENREFIARYIPNPLTVKQVISAQHDQSLSSERYGPSS